MAPALADSPEPYLEREQPRLGHGRGSYALGDAADLGAPTGPPETVLPGIVDGTYPFTARLHGVGEQSAADDLLRRGETYAGYAPRPFCGPDGQ